MMNQDYVKRGLSRRQVLKLGGGLISLGTLSALLPKALLQPTQVVEAAGKELITMPDLHFAASDGWIYLPDPPVPPYHPDNMAPSPLTTYIFGFRNVTGLTHDQVFAQKMKVQLVAPTWWIDQETDFTLQITNLGLQMRPDLVDSHTLHFHGFRNAIPIFDGEPHSSVGVPISRDLIYFYRPHHPGTYMYHCHFEETEHVHMGMVGVVFVRPLLDQTLSPRRFCYNDESTEFDREFTMMLNEIWTFAHWCDSHVQLPEWSDYLPDFWLLNGRVYPDTIAPPGGGNDPVTGDLIPPDGRPELQYQPISSLVNCNVGDRVLLRFVNLGYEEQSMRLTDIPMRLVGRDATLLQGRDNTDLTYMTDTVIVGPGESADAIFVAPDVTPDDGLDYRRFFLYNRNANRISNGGAPGYGGQMTEVHIYPASSPLPPQTEPNT
jgi:FtsP/CotA-like multicopper oxidase with cupredoxin domain